MLEIMPEHDSRSLSHAAMLNNPDSSSNDAGQIFRRREKNMLFTFLEKDCVNYHNNDAERAIRPCVVIRKITMGTSLKTELEQ